MLTLVVLTPGSTQNMPSNKDAKATPAKIVSTGIFYESVSNNGNGKIQGVCLKGDTILSGITQQSGCSRLGDGVCNLSQQCCKDLGGTFVTL